MFLVDFAVGMCITAHAVYFPYALLVHIHHAASSHVMLLPAVPVQINILGMSTVTL